MQNPSQKTALASRSGCLKSRIGCVLIFFLAVIMVQQAFAGEGKPDPLAADMGASPGGKIVVFAGQYPKSVNYYLENSSFAAEIFGYFFESLLSINPVSLEYEPGLADHWEISKDKKTFIFHIDPKAKWSDGRPVTAKDVIWTYKTVMDPKNMTGAHKLNMGRFSPPELIDRLTVRFSAKTIHWQNLLTLAGFQVMPEHAYAGMDFNTVNFSFPVISGPYALFKLEETRFIEIDKRDDWWQASAPENKGKYNFKKIVFKFFAERENAFEAFKKGEIDLFPIYTSRLWIRETNGDDFISNRIVKQKIYNHRPVGFQGFAMNMRTFPFDDLAARKAMALLLDREKMNQALMYGQYFLHRSYYEDLYLDKYPCENPVVSMDKKKAARILADAGWRANPETGVLEKNGRPFSFKFLIREAASEKFLSIYAEDLKDVGIVLEIDKKDWATWAMDMDGFNFQMTWAAWGAGIFKDPEGMWASSEAGRTGGSNITGFSDPVVDRLVETQKTIFDMDKRNNICRQIDAIVSRAYPYVLLWNIDYTRLLYWNRFGMPATVLSKYGDETSTLTYWWLDEDADAALRDALKDNLPLPPRPFTVRFDETFNK